MYGPWVYPWKQGDEHCYVDHPFEYLGLAYGLPVVEQQVVGDVEYEYTLHHAQEGAQVQGLCRLESKPANIINVVMQNTAITIVIMPSAPDISLILAMKCCIKRI